jgi:TrwC relaxase
MNQPVICDRLRPPSLDALDDRPPSLGDQQPRIAGGRGVADPQLHLHYLLIGALDTNDQLRALDSRVLANYQAELEAEATGHLTELLRQRGFEIERRLEQRRNGQPRVVWEVKGVRGSLIKAMSSRTTEMAELKTKFMAEYGRDWEAWIVK